MHLLVPHLPVTIEPLLNNQYGRGKFLFVMRNNEMPLQWMLAYHDTLLKKQTKLYECGYKIIQCTLIIHEYHICLELIHILVVIDCAFTLSCLSVWFWWCLVLQVLTKIYQENVILIQIGQQVCNSAYDSEHIFMVIYIIHTDCFHHSYTNNKVDLYMFMWNISVLCYTHNKLCFYLIWHLGMKT
jgi:hypothetical protein